MEFKFMLSSHNKTLSQHLISPMMCLVKNGSKSLKFGKIGIQIHIGMDGFGHTQFMKVQRSFSTPFEIFQFFFSM